MNINKNINFKLLALTNQNKSLKSKNLYITIAEIKAKVLNFIFFLKKKNKTDDIIIGTIKTVKP